MAGYPGENVVTSIGSGLYAKAEEWQGNGQVTTSKLFATNPDALAIYNLTLNGGVGTVGVGGSVAYPGMSGAPVFAGNSIIGVFVGGSSSYQEFYPLNLSTIQWITSNIATYSSTVSSSKGNEAVSGVWDNVSWTFSNTGVLTIGSGTVTDSSLASDNPFVVLGAAIKSVVFSGALTVQNPAALLPFFTNTPNKTLTTGFSNVSIYPAYVQNGVPAPVINATSFTLYTTQKYVENDSVLHVTNSEGVSISTTSPTYYIVDSTTDSSGTTYTLAFVYTDPVSGLTGIATAKLYNIPDYTGFTTA
ncbi:MAG: hypothetical protein LBI43_06180 [Streptococcaceae bacterium]|jgi:hypothetical protein|nr:hypothetical protein [Streptococcaceae bacterium]